VHIDRKPLSGEDGAPAGIVLTLRDVTEEHRSRHLLTQLIWGVDAVTGRGFLADLLERLCTTLKAGAALVAQVMEADPSRMETLAYCRDGEILENVSYVLAGTPCAMVLKGFRAHIFPDDVRGEFPADRFLAELEARGYAGIPLVDSSGAAIGVLAVVFREPVENPGYLEKLLGLFQVRLGAELERMAFERKISASEAEKRMILDSFEDVGLHFVDRNLAPAWSNPAGTRLWAAVELCGDACGVPDTSVCPRCAAKLTLERGAEREDEIHCPDGTGEVRDYLVRTLPVREADGALRGALQVALDITHRNRAEALRRESEHLFQGLFLENPAVSWFVSPETGDILEANPAASRFYGYPPETLRRMKVWDINQLPEATVRARMAEVKRSACMFEPFPHRLADGTVRDVAIFASPVIFRGRNCLYSIIVDITERKAAERALAERERMYRLLAEHGHDVVWRMDESFVCAWVSPSVDRLLGYSPEELIGKSWEILFAPDQRDEAKAAIDRWHEKERRGEAGVESRKWAFALRRKGGDPVWVEITTTPVREMDGTFDGFVGTMRDVTEAMRAEEMIRVSEDRFHSFMIHFPGFAFIKAADGRYIWANRSPAGDEIIPPERLAGRTDHDIFPAIFAEHYEKTDQEVRETGRRVQTVAAAPSRDRDRYQLISKFPIGSERPVARIGGMAIDITELVETREQLRTALQEKEMLLREVHHRVKNNLAVINSLFALQARRSAHPEVRSALEQSASRISAMALIHENLYRGDRLGAVDFRGYAEGLGRSLLENLSLVAGPVRLTVQSRHVVLPLEQAVTCGLILNELLMNSLKYAFPSGRGGAIVISARVSHGGHSEPRVEVSVRDDGVGLPDGAEKKDTLGMRIVRLMVERQLRGQLETLQGTGAGFRFHWPAGNISESKSF
jgi:PAS domain S-box-containing protein